LAALSDHAATVFEGVVAEVRSYWAGSPRTIVSDVTLTSVTYLKGGPATAIATASLTVPGGTIGSWQMRISGAPELKPGEKWLLFLLPSYQTFPTVGIWQGALRIQEDGAGVARMFTSSGTPIYGDAESPPGLVDAARSREQFPDGGVSARPTLRNGAIPNDGPPAMTHSDFLCRLRPVLNRSRVHPKDPWMARCVQEPFLKTSLQPASGGTTISRLGRAARIENREQKGKSPAADAEHKP